MEEKDKRKIGCVTPHQVNDVTDGERTVWEVKIGKEGGFGTESHDHAQIISMLARIQEDLGIDGDESVFEKETKND